MKKITIITYITKLHRARFSKLGNRKIGRLWLNEQLAERHLLAPEHRPHSEGELRFVLQQKKELLLRYNGKF